MLSIVLSDIPSVTKFLTVKNEFKNFAFHIKYHDSISSYVSCLDAIKILFYQRILWKRYQWRKNEWSLKWYSKELKTRVLKYAPRALNFVQILCSFPLSLFTWIKLRLIFLTSGSTVIVKNIFILFLIEIIKALIQSYLDSSQLSSIKGQPPISLSKFFKVT
jgi:hypothetical protein